MSLFAGFEFVTEISNATLTKLIKGSVSLDGVLLNPPCELTLPFTGGSAYLVIKDLQVDLEGDDSITLSLAFSDSSVRLTSINLGASQTIIGKNIVVAPLDGTVAVNIMLALVKGIKNRQEVSGDTSTAAVRISYSPAAEQVMASVLTGAVITADELKTL